MGSLARFLWAFCLSMLVLLGARGAAAEGRVIRVCVRDGRIPSHVREWTYTSGDQVEVTANKVEFMTRSFGHDRFIYDPAAPPSNNRLLPIPYNKLECPEYVPPVKPKPPPPPPSKPAPEAKKDEKKEEARPAGAKPSSQKVEEAQRPEPEKKPTPRPARARRPEEQVLPQTRLLPPPERLPEQKPTLPVVQKSRRPQPMVAACGECKPKKPGEKKTKADEIGQEMALAAAIATMQMNEDLQRPDGKKNGIVGGKNPDGIDHPAAQIAAASVVLIATIGSQSAAFKKALKAAIKKGTPLIVKTLDDLSEEAAKKLATRYGPAIADALNKVGGIGPYRVWRKFTEGYGGHWQAHHILEEKMFEKFRHFGDPNDGPSVILTEVEHKAITAKLLKAQTRAVETTAQLWKKYQDVYKKNPEYLEAIRHYFEKGK